MRKVGIITIIDHANYGNRLQNYAVKEIMKKLGYEAETLLINCGDRKQYYTYGFRLLMDKITKFAFTLLEIRVKNDKRVYLRYKKFREFNNKYITTKIIWKWNEEEKDKIRSQYAYFIVGSDQIWNPQLGNGRSIDFLEFADREQRICLSPSFGISKIASSDITRFQKGLLGFNMISVREDSGKEIVAKLTNKEATVLLDPTMFLEREEWESLIKSDSKIKEKYLLYYFLGTELYKKEVEEIADRYRLKIVRLQKDSADYISDPSDFLALIKNAELVCTDSFHAVVFSIIFGTSFQVYNRMGVGSRMQDRIMTLLNKLNLQEKLPENSRNYDLFYKNYSRAYEIIEEERKKTLQFLKEQMENI